MAGLSLRCCPQPLNHLAWGINRYQQNCGWPWSNITIYHLLFFRITHCIPSAVPILAKIPIFYNRCTFSEFPPSIADSVSLMNVPHSSSRSPVIFSFYSKCTVYLSCIKHQSWYSACVALLSSNSMHCYVEGNAQHFTYDYASDTLVENHCWFCISVNAYHDSICTRCQFVIFLIQY